MSVLREVMIAKGFREDLEPKAVSELLAESALVVRRAGLEHLVNTATLAEIMALADAGEALAKERAALVVVTLQNPAKAFAAFDGGSSLRREVMRTALALSRGGSCG